MEIIKNLDSITKEITVVDFFATWCPPCKMLAPVLEELKNIDVFKVNVDESPELAKEYRIEFVPTLIIFKDKVEVARNSGFMNIDDLNKWIDSFR